jgi:hypothetical protein
VVPRATKVERCGMPEIMALLSKRFASWRFNGDSLVISFF